ncbi:MAG: acyloxyacyl hydrolase, partial [Chlorobi bacterium]|nr:acyloxyacyl hydrolase [Chlorobiota bacterium]
MDSVRAFWRALPVLAVLSAVRVQAQFVEGGQVHFPLLYSWAHHDYMKALTGRAVPAGGAAVYFPLRGNWRKAYGYPSAGLGAIWMDLREPVLGRVGGIYAFMEFYAGPGHGRWRGVFLLGEGVAAVSRPYDKETNPKNVVFGSRWVHAFRAGAALRYRSPESHAFWEGGITLFHFSNGAWKTPNAGLNLPGLYVAGGWKMPGRP